LSTPATRLQRSEGTVHVAFKKRGYRTVLDSLYQQGCYQARFPNTEASQPAEAVLINTSGGLTDGDSLSCTAEWQAATTAVITTQAAERIYRSRESSARIETDLRVGELASACWLPQETIVFEGARLHRSTTVEMAGGASLFAAEIVVLGRSAMGEVVRTGRLFDRWRIRRAGELVFADAVLLDDALARNLETHCTRQAIAGGANCFATLVYVADDRGKALDRIRDILCEHDVVGGASEMDRLIVARILANGCQGMRSVVAAIFEAVQGKSMQLPRVWNC
jgi:urease accessory protein